MEFWLLVGIPLALEPELASTGEDHSLHKQIPLYMSMN